MGSTTQTRVTFGGASVNDEVKHFYLENKTPIDKIIAIGTSRHKLSVEAIKEAAVRVFDEIQEGEEIKPIRVAWRVYSLAKHLHMTNIGNERGKIEQLNSEITELKKRLEWQLQPWWKRIGRRYE